MMDYEEFRLKVKEHFIDYLPTSFADCIVDVRETNKVNVIKDSLSVKTENQTVVPCIYINDMYENYKDGESFDSVMSHFAELYAKASNEKPAVSIDDININDVTIHLINKDSNLEMLENIPHRDYLDMAIVYRINLNLGDVGAGTVLINNELAARFNLTEEGLYSMAMENTRMTRPPVVQSMEDMLRDMMINDGMSDDMIDEMIGFVDNPMIVVTNVEKCHGASSILFEDVLAGIAKEKDSDLYILPSSIHEVIVLPVEGMDPDYLSSMVSEVNTSQVRPEERLSNNIYKYDAKKKELSIVEIKKDANNDMQDNVLENAKTADKGLTM